MIKRLVKRYLSQPSLEQQRQSLAMSEWSSEALYDYLRTPLPELAQPITQLEFVAVDFETTGLNLEQDKVLTIGMVDFTLDGIDVGSSRELYVNHGQYIKAETAQINEITPSQVANGIGINDAFDQLLESIKGKIVLAHNTCIEKGFLETHLCNAHGLSSLPCYFLDTMHIEKNFSYYGKKRMHTSFHLDALRQHYGLPNYYSHSAASDALACAELFLVQCKKLNLQHSTLADVVLPS
ncbi:exonuclease domain-containing protein [Vibrio parahaemolyticus]|uniref:exonuclease domain-containing protein n=1 Tax=Vibrio mediterranei TaxID=689 RepID=UPI0040681377